MRLNDIYTEEKVRLDPACWHNKKIGNPKTKMKGGVRVNNCVPKEGVEEGVRDLGYDAQSLIMKLRRDVEEKRLQPTPQAVLAAATELAGDMDFAPQLLIKQVLGQGVEEDLSRRGFLRGLGMAAAGAAGLGAAGAAQARAPDEWQAKVERAKALMAKGQSREQTARIMGIKGPNPGGTGPMSGDWGAVNYAAQEMRVKEEYNPEYDDEAGMVENNLETLDRTVQGLDDLINSGDNLPEWCQEKIAVAKSMLVSVWDYMYSEEASDEVDPEVDEMYEAMDQLAEEMAAKHNVNIDTVWETFEAMDDNVLYETAAWRRKEGKSKTGGLNAKGVASYRRENPGSKLQTAVTTKPSKLKPGSKAAKRRKSFCARMSGVKGPMKKPNGKPTRKALALRKWNC